MSATEEEEGLEEKGAKRGMKRVIARTKKKISWRERQCGCVHCISRIVADERESEAGGGGGAENAVRGRMERSSGEGEAMRKKRETMEEKRGQNKSNEGEHLNNR